MRRLWEQRLRGCRLWGQLLAQLTLLLPLLQYALGQCASGNKDPHLNFAHGGTADFRGRDKTYFNFFSGPKLSVNVLIEDATFVISDDRGSLTVGYTLGGGGSNYGGGETGVPCYGGSKGDPHLAFAHGGKADFRGKNGAIYCFLSTPGLALNVKTEATTLPTSLQPPRSHTASTLALRCA